MDSLEIRILHQRRNGGVIPSSPTIFELNKMKAENDQLKEKYEILLDENMTIVRKNRKLKAENEVDEA